MKKIILTIGILFFLFNLGNTWANDEERRILEQTLVEEAVTKEQKLALVHYFKGIAAEKRRLARVYDEEAATSHGGKSSGDQKKAEKLKKSSKILKDLANSYDKKASEIEKSISETGNKK